MKLKLALLATLAVASVNAMACYTVYDQSNRVVYNAQTAPVDMSRPLHETLPVIFPGGHMVFGATTDCPREPFVRAAPVVARASGKPAPLLTDLRTAETMHMPHTILPSGVALVANPPPLAGGVTVATAAIPATSAEIPVFYSAPAVALRTQQHREIVITEMHNPPLTVIQQGGMVVSER